MNDMQKLTRAVEALTRTMEASLPAAVVASLTVAPTAPPGDADNPGAPIDIISPGAPLDLAGPEVSLPPGAFGAPVDQGE